MTHNIFIGYDHREKVAFDVCKHSILKYCPDANIIPLEHKELRKAGLFTRPWVINSDGSFKDMRDDRPFSTEFAFTRFLVPFLFDRCKGQSGWSLFIDCDMLFTQSVEELFRLADEKYAVMVVKHDYTHTNKPLEATKMDGCVQQSYERKNWSSFILWNHNHPANKNLSLQQVNYMPGSWLHSFSWLKDEEIGKLPESWNWLEGHSSSNIMPDNIHYTRGGPWFKDYKDVDYAKDWLAELGEMNLEK